MGQREAFSTSQHTACKPRVVGTYTNMTGDQKAETGGRQNLSLTRRRTVQHCTHRQGYTGDAHKHILFVVLWRSVVRHESNCCAEAQLFDDPIPALVWPKSCAPAQTLYVTSWATSKPSFRCCNARHETAMRDEITDCGFTSKDRQCYHR